MINMKIGTTKLAFLLTAFLLAFASPLQTQAQIYLSKNADFSTADRAFERNDKLHIKVVAENMDFNDLDKNELRIKPDEGDRDLKTTLANNMDGTYTRVVDLSTLDPSQTRWEVRIRLEDENDREVRAELDITIGAGAGGGIPNTDAFELRGFLDQITDSTITIQFQTFLLGDSVDVRDNNNLPILLSDLNINEFVEIRGVIDASGNLVVTRIKQESFNDDEVELTGAIEALGSNSVVVAGLTFTVDQQTMILDNDNQPIGFAELAVGLVVEIRADANGAGQLLATKIKIEDRFEDEVEVRGVASQVTDSSITVLNRLFMLTHRTVYLDNNNVTTTLAGITQGLPVEIRADLQPDGSLIALQVKQEDNPSRVEVQGPVDSLATNLIVVAGIHIRIDAATQYLDADNNSTAFSSLTVGQTVDIEATVQTQDIPLAQEVRIKAVSSIEGRIDVIDTAGLDMGNIRIAFNAVTLYLNNANFVLSNRNFRAGLYVQVRMEEQGGVLSATQVKLVETAHPLVLNTEENEQPQVATLQPNYPNPFNPATTISFSLDEGVAGASVSLVVYNALGQEVKRLISGAYQPGRYTVTWDATDRTGQDVASGIYFYRLHIANQATLTRSMTLLR